MRSWYIFGPQAAMIVDVWLSNRKKDQTLMTSQWNDISSQILLFRVTFDEKSLENKIRL